jgi:hypothetical protein
MSDMKKRFTLYGSGFVLGILMVFFFLGGKKASCNWLPNDRILNIIRQKQINFSEEVRSNLTEIGSDSLDIYRMLENGDVDFSKSRVKNDPCRLYWIQGEGRQKQLVITVEVCDSVATVNSLKKLEAAGE